MTIVYIIMSITSSNLTTRHRVLAVVAALSLGLAACGADDTVDAGVPAEETLPDRASEGEMEPDAGGSMTDGLTAITARTDLISLQTTAPDEVIVDPTDGSQLLAHFVGAAEPCSGAAVTVTETDADVTVLLETGLDPNAAAMSCIAQVFDYEITVALDAPLGDRTITIAD